MTCDTCIEWSDVERIRQTGADASTEYYEVDTGKLLHDEFWIYWIQRFESNASKYIRPDSPSVQGLVNSLGLNNTLNHRSDIDKLWRGVKDRVSYRLSKSWSTPMETLRMAEGDCEDVTFLVISAALYAGFDDVQMGLGWLNYPSGQRQEHVWAVINGKIVDATGYPNRVSEVTYDEVYSWTITNNEGQ